MAIIIINLAITALIIFIYEKERRTTLKKLLITFSTTNLALHMACEELKKYTNEDDKAIWKKYIKKAVKKMEKAEVDL